MCEQASAKKRRKVLPDPPNSVPKSRDLRDVIVAAKARNLAKLSQDAAEANMSPIDQTAAIQSMVRVAHLRACGLSPAAAYLFCVAHPLALMLARLTGGGLQSVP
eukprot:COSAG02_NODE_5484_length_4288_cov_15.095727_5_plen_105_part_00